MGKGDRKTAKGKRFNSSYGNVRSHAASKTTGSTASSVVKKPSASKAAGKKVVRKAAA